MVIRNGHCIEAIMNMDIMDWKNRVLYDFIHLKQLFQTQSTHLFQNQLPAAWITNIGVKRIVKLNSPHAYISEY